MGQPRSLHDARWCTCIRFVEQFHPDFAFPDIGLLKRNGYDLARRRQPSRAANSTILKVVTSWEQGKD
jgi:hypothetical protein